MKVQYHLQTQDNQRLAGSDTVILKNGIEK
jgi:hypothetical protein